jgi:cell division protein FtsW (lipid II flippase)
MRRALRLLIGPSLSPINGAWLCVLAALGLSLVGLYAIDLGVGGSGGGGSSDAPVGGFSLSGIVLRQAIFLGVGLLAAAMVATPHYRYIRLFAWPLMVIVLGLLVFLLVPFVPASIVTPRNGARAWINFGPVDLQPAELMKIAYVLVIADYLRFRQNHRTLAGLIPPALITCIPVGLIMLQPDLGTALLFAPALFAMLVAAGARLKHLSLAVLIAVMAAPAAYPLLRPHQQARIVGLIKSINDPEHGADAINYQGETAQRLAGAGGLRGQSEPKSRALVRFNRLPERHNDMILAVILNRFGLVGGLGVLLLYILWFTGAYLTAATSRDAFGRLIVVGFASIMAAQTAINLGMTLGVLPIIGLTLPFVSYGGSSVLTVWVMTGLTLGVALRRQQRFARPAFEFDETPYDPARVDKAHRGAHGLSGRST